VGGYTSPTASVAAGDVKLMSDEEVSIQRERRTPPSARAAHLSGAAGDV
jgi:hypothetical protein